ncbi:hypothetical protein NGRA_2661 [Nosema granulosis]|uniref:Uncharacterized protein n=1 Tax=Nosema granulosis TaxID=83296 RepID=A0A9P6GWP3_9MICR|nr:hypothetical protein NGRA_2661 [Nosema granulosis]
MKFKTVHFYFFILFVCGDIGLSDEENTRAIRIYQRLKDEKSKKKIAQNEFLFCSKPIFEEKFKQFVRVLKSNLMTEEFQKMLFYMDGLPFDAYKEGFFIKFIPIRFKKLCSKRYILFLELRRTIIELILLLGDNLISNLELLKHNSIFYDLLYGSLMGLYDILFTKNNLNEHLTPEYRFVPTNKTNFMDITASDVLNNMFCPKQFIPKYSKTLKTFLKPMKKNTEKYPFLTEGFKRFDYVSVKIKNKTKIYWAKYYFLGAILKNFDSK